MPAKNRDPHVESLLNQLFDEEVHRHILPNGLVLIVKPDNCAPVVSVQCFIRTGSIHEESTPGAGVSHYLEHMLFKGTASRTEQEIANEVQKHGGYSNAYTTYDHTAYYLDLASEHVGVGIDILADMVFSSLLDPAETEREKEVILREIAMYDDDPESRMGQILMETAFREHPFRYPIIGYRDIFADLQRDELWTYYKNRYAPNNAVLVIVGDVDPDRCREMVGERLGSLKRGRIPPSLIMGEPRQFGKRTQFLEENVQVSRQSMAFKVPGLEHPDAPGLQVLAGLLGQGKSSFLWRRIREELGLVHDISAGVWNPSQVGLLYLDFMTDPGKREKAALAVEKAVGHFTKESLSTEKLRKFVRHFLAHQIARKKSMSAQASALGSSEVVFGDLGFPRRMLREITRVTIDQVKALANHYFEADQCSVVALDPKGQGRRLRRSAVTPRVESGFTQETLANGVVLQWQEDHRLPTVVAQASLSGGLLLEGRAKAGASSLLARLLTKDTRHHAANEVEELTENAAIQLRASSGQTFLSLALECRPHNWKEGLNWWGEALTEPLLLEKRFAREKEAALASFQEEMDDPRELATYRFRQRFWGDQHPLGGWPEGDPASLQKLSVRDLEHLYQRLWVGSNLVVTLAGDFDAGRDLEPLRKLLQKIPTGPEVTASPVSRLTTRETSDLRETHPGEQEVVLLGFSYPGVLDPRTQLETGLLNELFNGMSSRLFDEVRNKRGLAYYVGAQPSFGLTEGMYLFYAGTAPGKGEEVLSAMRAEIRRIAGGGIESEEWERCLNFARSRYAMKRQSLNQRVAEASFDVRCGHSPNRFQTYLERLQAMKPEQVQKVAAEFLDPEGGVSYVLSPETS